ncbi:aminopeptidase N-like [Lingula anatina]|uniref:Aminopeptidase N-like n=1 Tax=Lingula anatina TaxID=7574 RepID=A0A1S3IQN1_LINAN|nr:aminopeptidase N-like [Lingula anatina]|eukprot:XP_013400221.1 aminopeptidase N-like [Lingula anatina]
MEGALSCSKDLWVLSRYLSYAKHNASIFPVSDSNNAILAVGSSPFGRKLAWDWIQAQWNSTDRVLGNRKELIGGILDGFWTKVDFQEVYSFRHKFGSAMDDYTRAALNEMLELMKANARWVTNNEEEVRHWLKTRVLQRSDAAH